MSSSTEEREGILNFSNLSLSVVPDRVWDYCSSSSSTNWWERAPLKRLYLSGNTISLFSPFTTLKKNHEELTACTKGTSRVDGAKIPRPFDQWDLRVWEEIEVIDLGDNQLSAFPFSFLQLSTLKQLKLNDNHLGKSDVPFFPSDELNRRAEMLDLPHLFSSNFSPLTVLCLQRNGFTSIEQLEQIFSSPNVIGSLRELRLSENDLSHFPQSICKLSALEILSLDRNQISVLPSSCTFEWPTMREINLSFNQIIAVPAHFLFLCTSLQRLFLTSNRLKELPSSFLTNQVFLFSFSRLFHDVG